MVSIKVKLVGSLRTEKEPELLITFKSDKDYVLLRDVLYELKRRGIKLNGPCSKPVILIDGKNASLLGGLEAKVVHGATVIFMTFAGGG